LDGRRWQPAARDEDLWLGKFDLAGFALDDGIPASGIAAPWPEDDSKPG